MKELGCVLFDFLQDSTEEKVNYYENSITSLFGDVKIYPESDSDGN